eukprot:TRINITY_DN7732_c0_g1_i3.p1 TRINITY_DN7732_c0_g1~~TRINITY_DN7732_c0_g1_i3.p1  ORF type:complete len:1099 (-),score=227.76 TRINITY_DN7732_c0_g1_i3:95-3391(-)
MSDHLIVGLELLDRLKQAIQNIMRERGMASVEDRSILINDLCEVLEQVLQGGFKEHGFLRTRTIWSFFENLKSCIPDGSKVIQRISSLQHLRTPRGKLRAFLRLALNEKALFDYISALFYAGHTQKYYDPNSIMMNEELQAIFYPLIESLSMENFTEDYQDPRLDQDAYLKRALMSSMPWEDTPSKSQTESGADLSFLSSKENDNQESAVSLAKTVDSIQESTVLFLACRAKGSEELIENLRQVVVEITDAIEPVEIYLDNMLIVTRLCESIEAIIVHDLQETGDKDDFGSLYCSFMFSVSECLPGMDKTIGYIKTIRCITTALGRARAFLRWSLNEGVLATNVQAIVWNYRNAQFTLRRGAVLRSNELSRMVIGYLDSLSGLRFQLGLEDPYLDSYDCWVYLSVLQEPDDDDIGCQSKASNGEEQKKPRSKKGKPSIEDIQAKKVQDVGEQTNYKDLIIQRLNMQSQLPILPPEPEPEPEIQTEPESGDTEVDECEEPVAIIPDKEKFVADLYDSVDFDSPVTPIQIIPKVATQSKNIDSKPNIAPQDLIGGQDESKLPLTGANYQKELKEAHSSESQPLDVFSVTQAPVLVENQSPQSSPVENLISCTDDIVDEIDATELTTNIYQTHEAVKSSLIVDGIQSEDHVAAPNVMEDEAEKDNLSSEESEDFDLDLDIHVTPLPSMEAFSINLKMEVQEEEKKFAPPPDFHSANSSSAHKKEKFEETQEIDSNAEEGSEQHNEYSRSPTKGEHSGNSGYKTAIQSVDQESSVDQDNSRPRVSSVGSSVGSISSLDDANKHNSSHGPQLFGTSGRFEQPESASRRVWGGDNMLFSTSNRRPTVAEHKRGGHIPELMYEDGESAFQDDESAVSKQEQRPFQRKERLRPNVSLVNVKKHTVAMQDNLCAGCSVELKPTSSLAAIPASLIYQWMTARYCDYTGKYYCSDCHWNEKSIIPYRLIFNWDSAQYGVCRSAKLEIEREMDQANIDLQEINPNLLETSRVLQNIKKIRMLILEMLPFAETCHQSTELMKIFRNREHFSGSPTIFSLRDIVDVQNRLMEENILLIRDQLLDHITSSCRTCRGKGSYCEMCRSDDVNPLY